jgi:hypothetical protein
MIEEYITLYNQQRFLMCKDFFFAIFELDEVLVVSICWKKDSISLSINALLLEISAHSSSDSVVSTLYFS